MHSEKYNEIKNYYDNNLWSEEQVKIMVSLGYITSAEYEEITGDVYTPPTNSTPTLLPSVSVSDNYKAIQVINGEWSLVNGYSTVTGYPLTLPDSLGKPLKSYTINGNSIQRLLPDGYTQLEYIESTGTQYIDTGYVPTDKLRIKTAVSLSSMGTSNQYFIGSSIALGRFCNMAFNPNSKILIISGAHLAVDAFDNLPSWSIGQWYNIDCTVANRDLSSMALTINGINYQGMDVNATTTGSIWLFALGGNALPFTGKMRRTWFINPDTNAIERDFVPTKNASNVVGMYDLVTNTFYTSAGTEDFVAGSVAPSPIAPIPIKSVGTLVESGEHAGEYVIPVKISDGINTSTYNIYIDRPLYKIGSVFDYIDFENLKVVRNFNSFNMGSVTWASTAYTGVYSYTPNNLYKVANWATTPLMLCTAYTRNNPDALSKTTTSMGVSSTPATPPAIWVKNTNYSTAAAMKQSLEGVIMIYRLQTPVEENITLPEINTYKGTNTITTDTEADPSGLSAIYRYRPMHT